MLTNRDIEEYLNILGANETHNAQAFLDAVGQDGVYMYYRAKMYNRLTNDQLNAVYLTLLKNIQLNEMKNKMGIDAIDTLSSRTGRILYVLDVTAEEDILGIGKDEWYQFLEYMSLEESKQTINLIKEGHLSYDRRSEAMVEKVFTFRHYINRRRGHESVRLMIRTYVEGLTEEMLKYNREDLEYKKILITVTSFLNQVNTLEPWNSMTQANGRLGTKWRGLTGSDKKEITELQNKVLKL